eukprot:scaffold91052_cov17-Tisochrysis_lutea.AAC.1
MVTVPGHCKFLKQGPISPASLIICMFISNRVNARKKRGNGCQSFSVRKRLRDHVLRAALHVVQPGAASHLNVQPSECSASSRHPFEKDVQINPNA